MSTSQTLSSPVHSSPPWRSHRSRVSTVLIDGYAGDRQPMATIVMQDFACCSVPSASNSPIIVKRAEEIRAIGAELNVISRVLHFFS